MTVAVYACSKCQTVAHANEPCLTPVCAGCASPMKFWYRYEA